MYRIEELDPSVFSYDRLGSMEEAADNPELDYFSQGHYRMRRPKAQIGAYVSDSGFEVPLIRTEQEWRAALGAGTALIRSDSLDEYAGLRGVFSSVAPSVEREHLDDYSPLGRRIIEAALDGLETGEIPPTWFMKHYAGRRTWDEALVYLYKSARSLGVDVEPEMPNASLWNYIPGHNVSIFGDPNVEGRYHIGFNPNRTPGSYGIVGGFKVEPDQHSMPQRSRKHDVNFVPEPVIETYEQIATLPLFDTLQRPVMELQVDELGVVHFLQYYRTGHRQDYCDQFEIPFNSKQDIGLGMVRGSTGPEGKTMRLFISPRRIEAGIQGEGIYSGAFARARGRIDAQMMARSAGFVLHHDYIGFQDNHYDSAPLFMPDLAAGLYGITETTDLGVARRVTDLLERAETPAIKDYDNAYYFDIKVTSNGREAVLSSDWQLSQVSYEELRYAA